MTAPGRQGSALVIGEALVDVVIHPGQEPVDIPGGSPANVALGLARLGRDAELHCWIGTDERGKAVRAHLEASGVRLAAGADGAERTSTAQATIGEDRAATYLFDLDWNPPRPNLADGEAPLLVHTGSIAAILAPGAATVEQVLRETRATSTIAYDPNARPQLMGEPEDARRIVERLVALSASGVRLEVPADPSVVVADTVGAGDSFMGGLEDALWSEDLVGADRREALRAVDAETLERIVRHAAAIADITVSRAGANPPTRDELP